MDFYAAIKKLKHMRVYMGADNLYPSCAEHLYEYDSLRQTVIQYKVHPQIFERLLTTEYVEENFMGMGNIIVRSRLPIADGDSIISTFFIENDEVSSRYYVAMFEDKHACKYVGKKLSSKKLGSYVMQHLYHMTKYQKRKISI